MNKNNKIISITIGVAIISISGSFYAGVKYNQSKNIMTGRRVGGFANLSQEERQARMDQFGNSIGIEGPRGMRGTGTLGGSVALGELISKDDKSITVKLRDGGSKIVFLSKVTSVTKTIEGATGDLSVGKQVTAIGNTNPDGSITAQSIQIRPSEQIQ